MAFIGIDIGSSFIKGSLLDLDRKVLTHVRRVSFPPPLQGLPPGHREVDPRHVVDAVRSLIDGLTVAPAEAVDGVVMCSQMHGLVLTTARGEPRSNLITWQDQRTLQPHPSGQGTCFDVMAQRVNPTQVRQLGNELDPRRPVSFLFWLAEQGLLTDPSLIPASLPDFVLANLCQTQPATDSTNAAAHGAFNRRPAIGTSRCWPAWAWIVCAGPSWYPTGLLSEPWSSVGGPCPATHRSATRSVPSWARCWTMVSCR